MRHRSYLLFALGTAALTMSACNLIFSIDPGSLAATGGGAPDGGSTGAGGSGGSTGSTTSATMSGSTSSSTGSTGSTGSTSSSTGGTGGAMPCAPNTVTCEGAVLHACDANGAPMADVTCDAVAGCDAAAGKCIDRATLPRLGIGEGRACVIEDDQSVRCWGSNGGLLVLGDAHATAPIAAPVPGLAGVRGVAVGTSHACVVGDDGTVTCWGSNDSGETGVQPGSGAGPFAVTMPAGVPALQVSVANRCSCARLQDGRIACWGQEDTGCFGNASQTSTPTPTPTLVPGVTGAVQLRTGVYYVPTCARLASGKVTCWGIGTTPTEIGGVDDAIDITVARHFVFILSASKGALWSTPVAGGFTAAAPYVVAGAPTSIAAGDNFCALRADGTVACTSIDGPPPPAPSLVPSLPAGAIVELAAGYSDISVYGTGLQCLRLAGTPLASRVYCWGDDASHALGANAPSAFRTPQNVPGITNAATISASFDSTTAVLTTGAVAVWGQTSALPAPVSAAPKTVSALGTDNASAHTRDVDRLAVVVKKSGALAMFDTGAPLTNARLLKAGTGGYADARSFSSFDLARLANGSLVVYGASASSNDSGIFGNGTNTAVADTFQTVAGLTITAFAAHGYEYGSQPAHACAIVSPTGGVSCWGNNGFGEIGTGLAGASVNVPTAVTIPDPVVSVAVGAYFSCAVSTAGAVYCWGNNRQGQLGIDPATPEFPSPIAVPGISTAVGVTAAESHVCAWLADKTVLCWGTNSDGQLGDGTLDAHFAPTPVLNLTNVVEASAGPTHVCARRADNTVACWGSAHNGQIGNSVVGLFTVPQMVLGL